MSIGRQTQGIHAIDMTGDMLLETLKDRFWTAEESNLGREVNGRAAR